jgi:hypothetical protein
VEDWTAARAMREDGADNLPGRSADVHRRSADRHLRAGHSDRPTRQAHRGARHAHLHAHSRALRASHARSSRTDAPLKLRRVPRTALGNAYDCKEPPSCPFHRGRGSHRHRGAGRAATPGHAGFPADRSPPGAGRLPRPPRAGIGPPRPISPLAMPDPKPFVWTQTADDILASIARTANTSLTHITREYAARRR